MKTIVTHNNNFHPDDVFAVATAQLVFGKDKLKIERTRDQAKIAAADIVVDVGYEYDPERHRFDHHQPDAPIRDNSIPYAAFGLIWHSYGEVITSKFVAEKIEQQLVLPIDAGDNGVGLYEVKAGMVPPAELFAVILSYVPFGEVTDEMYDAAFIKAVDFARGYLERTIKFYEHQESELKRAQALVAAADDKEIIVSNEPISSYLFSEFSDVKVVVAPKRSGETMQWRASAVADATDAYSKRALFPEAWAGLRDEALEEVSGIPGAKFCHRGLFLFVTEDKAGALKAAKAALG